MSDQPTPIGLEDAAKALLDPSQPVRDPSLQFLQVAMSGFGYNFYDARNVARANDQLVRGRSSDTLGTAAIALDRLEKNYLALAFPGATREEPYPPPDVMRNVRLIEALRTRVHALASAIVAAETPATDAIWFRFRDERSLLQTLVAYDLAISTGSDAVTAAVEAVTPVGVDPSALTNLEAELTKLEHCFAARRDLLRGGTAGLPGSNVVPKR